MNDLNLKATSTVLEAAERTEAILRQQLEAPAPARPPAPRPRPSRLRAWLQEVRWRVTEWTTSAGDLDP
ncbi:MAG: hypothetical protein RIB46_14260 [Pseudomonadales bacterium]